MSILTLILLVSCSKEIPPHLRVDRPLAKAEPSTNPLERLVGSDPLVRRPDPGEAGDWSALKQGNALEAWADTARQPSPDPSAWLEIETRWPGTMAVPLARGARLAVIEVGGGSWEDEDQRRLAAWAGATRVDVNPTTDKPRAPLDWVDGRTEADKRASLRVAAERSVLSGWLSGPDIPLDATANALRGEQYSGLRTSPMGTLLEARASRAEDPAALNQGLKALETATSWALRNAAADSDQEQAQLRAERANEAALLGGVDPTAHALENALSLFNQTAGSDAGAGLALVAITASRILNHCPDKPCGGLDRAQTLQQASTWHPSVRPWAQLWLVIQLKQSLDTVHAGWNKPAFGTRLVDVLDTLSGTGGGPIELPMLRYRDTEPTMLMQLARMADGSPSTDPGEVVRAFRNRLATACKDLQAPTPTLQTDLNRACPAP